VVLDNQKKEAPSEKSAMMHSLDVQPDPNPSAHREYCQGDNDGVDHRHSVCPGDGLWHPLSDQEAEMLKINLVEHQVTVSTLQRFKIGDRVRVLHKGAWIPLTIRKIAYALPPRVPQDSTRILANCVYEMVGKGHRLQVSERVSAPDSIREGWGDDQ
jgi:hypothetical protein